MGLVTLFLFAIGLPFAVVGILFAFVTLRSDPPIAAAVPTADTEPKKKAQKKKKSKKND